MLKLISALLAVAYIVGGSVPAVAQAETKSSEAQPRTNANERICQKQEVTGSRLGKKTVCKTRAEWADFQLQERKTIEDYQTKRGMKGQ
jgi:hypothetical protein